MRRTGIGEDRGFGRGRPVLAWRCGSGVSARRRAGPPVPRGRAGWSAGRTGRSSAGKVLRLWVVFVVSNSQHTCSYLSLTYSLHKLVQGSYCAGAFCADTIRNYSWQMRVSCGNKWELVIGCGLGVGYRLWADAPRRGIAARGLREAPACRGESGAVNGLAIIREPRADSLWLRPPPRDPARPRRRPACPPGHANPPCRLKRAGRPSLH